MNKIKKLRRNLGLSQSELAEVLGISVRTIQDWDMDRSYPKDYYERLLLDEMRRATGRLKELRIQYKAAYAYTEENWFGEYHDTLGDAISELSLPKRDGAMEGYVYKTAIALDEDGEWTEEAAVELGWTGDIWEDCSSIYDINNESEYLKTLDYSTDDLKSAYFEDDEDKDEYGTYELQFFTDAGYVTIKNIKVSEKVGQDYWTNEKIAEVVAKAENEDFKFK